MTMAMTAFAVGALAVIFMVSRWNEANKIAVAVSALAAVGAVGVAIWAAIPTGSPGGRLRVSRTGRVTAGMGGRANSGVSAPAGLLSGNVQVHRTGDADAAQGGDANSGIQLS